MKKLINAPDAVVRDALRGVEAAHGDRVRVSYDPAFIVRADAPVQGKVGLVSGGGSGHEPMHGGFVGPGMLDAACPGEVFTSPTPDQMLDATKAVNGGAGVLHIVKNYTGDVMNFEMAADLGQGEGIEVEAVVIDDDVAVQDSLYTAGRRGVGITVIAEKICGAAAEEGQSLAQVAELCRKVNGQGRSMGMALTPCITPASGEPSFELADDEVEQLSRELEADQMNPSDPHAWWGSRKVTLMLEILQGRGIVAVVGRRGKQRVWDLADRFRRHGQRDGGPHGIRHIGEAA